MKLIFSGKVSDEFIHRVIEISLRLKVNPNYLMACMAFESDETFSSTITNYAGSGAVGLIQFMPNTAIAMGTTSKMLSDMTAEKQLNFVEKYFSPYKERLDTLEDTYMAILYPAAIGKPNDYVLFRRDDIKHPKQYRQNNRLDFNKDGIIIKAEAAAAVRQKYDKGIGTKDDPEFDLDEYFKIYEPRGLELIK